MLVIPAIDLKNGHCVRLIQGKIGSETVYSENPTAVALKFEELGAKRIHLVDIDGAFRGKKINIHCIKSIVKNASIPIQVGGGLRNEDDIDEMFDIGVSNVIIGTLAVKEPKIFESIIKRFSGNKIILGIDMLNRKISIQGWKEDTKLDDVAFAKIWKEMGINRTIYTDISRDGMLSGPNIFALKDFAIRTNLNVVASGGITSINDLEKINKLKKFGVDQVIIGKAIYEGKINLKELI